MTVVSPTDLSLSDGERVLHSRQKWESWSVWTPMVECGGGGDVCSPANVVGVCIVGMPVWKLLRPLLHSCR